MRLHSRATISGMSTGCDCQAEAEAAMKLAVAATCEHDRLKWVRVAQVWQDLGRFRAESRVVARISFHLATERCDAAIE